MANYAWSKSGVTVLSHVSMTYFGLGMELGPGQEDPRRHLKGFWERFPYKLKKSTKEKMSFFRRCHVSVCCLEQPLWNSAGRKH